MTSALNSGVKVLRFRFAIENSFQVDCYCSKVVVEGRPSTTPSKPCVRLSPHMAFQSSVAINALGDNNHFYLFLIHTSKTSIF